MPREIGEQGGCPEQGTTRVKSLLSGMIRMGYGSQKGITLEAPSADPLPTVKIPSLQLMKRSSRELNPVSLKREGRPTVMIGKMLTEIISFCLIPANLYMRKSHCSEVMGRKNVLLLPSLNSFSWWRGNNLSDWTDRSCLTAIGPCFSLRWD